MARIRAIENRRYLLRATNNGISAVIDPYGRILRRGPRFERSILSGTFEYRKDTTFYTEQGDIFAWVCCLGSLLALGFKIHLGPTISNASVKGVTVIEEHQRTFNELKSPHR